MLVFIDKRWWVTIIKIYQFWVLQSLVSKKITWSKRQIWWAFIFEEIKRKIFSRLQNSAAMKRSYIKLIHFEVIMWLFDQNQKRWSVSNIKFQSNYQVASLLKSKISDHMALSDDWIVTRRSFCMNFAHHWTLLNSVGYVEDKVHMPHRCWNIIIVIRGGQTAILVCWSACPLSSRLPKWLWTSGLVKIADQR